MPYESQILYMMQFAKDHKLFSRRDGSFDLRAFNKEYEALDWARMEYQAPRPLTAAWEDFQSYKAEQSCWKYIFGMETRNVEEFPGRPPADPRKNSEAPAPAPLASTAGESHSKARTTYKSMYDVILHMAKAFKLYPSPDGRFDVDAFNAAHQEQISWVQNVHNQPNCEGPQWQDFVQYRAERRHFQILFGQDSKLAAFNVEFPGEEVPKPSMPQPSQARHHDQRSAATYESQEPPEVSNCPLRFPSPQFGASRESDRAPTPMSNCRRRSRSPTRQRSGSDSMQNRLSQNTRGRSPLRARASEGRFRDDLTGQSRVGTPRAPKEEEVGKEEVKIKREPSQ